LSSSGALIGDPSLSRTDEAAAVNAKHLELCGGDDWAEAVERYIIPWTLEGLELGDDVLEVGPGPGRTTDVLLRLATRLTAAEVDPELAALLSDRLAGTGVEVIHADATDLPFADGRFSAALSFIMLHHVPSAAKQDELFAEVARVLRPGGFLAGVDSLDSEDFRALHVDDVCVPVPPDGLAARLRAAGFADAQVDVNEYAVRFRATTTPA
jgi:SAM-dependent methyltransferase